MPASSSGYEGDNYGGPSEAFHTVNGVLTRIGRPAGSVWSVANGINAAGAIAVVASRPYGYGAFTWVDGVFTELPGAGGSALPAAINASGVVVGHTVDVGTGRLSAARSENGSRVNLPALPGGSESEALAINADGVIAGWSTTLSGEVHAVVWISGVVFDLGAPAGATSHLEATGISDSGVVAGWYVTATGDTHAFVTAADPHPPTVTCGGADGAWHSTDVTIACTASDGESGLADPADVSFSLITSVAAGGETSDAQTTARTVCDNAANCTTAGPIGGNRIDGERRRFPSARQQALPIRFEAVLASYACADPASGVAVCSGSASHGAPIDTSTVGSHTFAVTATDAAGNSATAYVAYAVLAPIPGDSIERWRVSSGFSTLAAFGDGTLLAAGVSGAGKMNPRTGASLGAFPADARTSIRLSTGDQDYSVGGYQGRDAYRQDGTLARSLMAYLGCCNIPHYPMALDPVRDLAYVQANGELRRRRRRLRRTGVPRSQYAVHLRSVQRASRLLDDRPDHASRNRGRNERSHRRSVVRARWLVGRRAEELLVPLRSRDLDMDRAYRLASRAHIWREHGARGKFYATGGEQSSTALDIYDPATESWTSKTMPVGYQHHGAMAIDGRLYLVGGQQFVNGVFTSEKVVMAYDPTFMSLSPSVCAVAGNTVSLSGLGVCTIAANQAGGPGYLAAPQVTQAFDVSSQPAAAQVSAGGYSSCALKVDGTVACWGDPAFATVPASAAVSVREVSAGYSHSCAAKRDDSVVCWGDNTFGQTATPAGLGSVVSVSAGGYHTCAALKDQTVACWGYDSFGQANVPRGLTGVLNVSAGLFHSCALKNDGTVVCWGLNNGGQSTPPAGLNDVTAVSAGGSHSCAVKREGSAQCWGYDAYNQVTGAATFASITAISAGGFHTCALQADATVRCVGGNGYGQEVVPVGLRAVTGVSAGYGHTCALKAEGAVCLLG